MLTRDAWEMQRGYTSHEAKQLYVESMLKILRRFGDRPQAISLIAELEAYSGDVAEQVMNGTLAETASLHSSSLSQSPPPRSHADEVTSSVADEDYRDTLPFHRQPRLSDAQTASGSNSHDTVTGSDMPPASDAPERRPSARRPRVSETQSQKHQSVRTPRMSRGSLSRQAPAAPPTVSARSDAASQSFASCLLYTSPSPRD